MTIDTDTARKRYLSWMFHPKLNSKITK